MSPTRRNKPPPPPFGVRGALALLFWLVLLGIMIGLLLADTVRHGTNMGYLAAVAVVAVAVVLGLPLALVGMLILLAVFRQRRMRSEEYEFGRVRKVAETQGAVVRVGEATAWVAEPDDHPPLLHEALETVRTRFRQLLPNSRPEIDAPLRIICFEDKRHLEAYGRGFGLPFEALDGVYLLGRPRRILMAMEVVPRRPAEPTRTLRAVFAHFFLERFKGFLLPNWLGTATTYLIASTGERGEAARLNRKALASLARDGLPDADAVFGPKGRRLLSLLRNWASFEGYTRVWRALLYGRSLGEYLGGSLATPERLMRFRAFVTELGKSDPPERVFEEAFGHGFDQLLKDWRQAVEAQGVGEHESPPERVRAALLNRAIPLVADPRAEPWDRIRAIRDMASAGYPLGADTLIRALAEERGDVARQAAFALEAISGIAAGNDVERWWAWWRSLPSAAAPARDGSIRAAGEK
jgi:hypothetical protein